MGNLDFLSLLTIYDWEFLEFRDFRNSSGTLVSFRNLSGFFGKFARFFRMIYAVPLEASHSYFFIGDGGFIDCKSLYPSKRIRFSIANNRMSIALVFKEPISSF